MAEHGYTVEDQTVLNTVTAVEITQQTATGSSVTPSTSRTTDFYFQCAVIVIGVVGTAANALILYAMVASEQHKTHLLIFNQNLLDLLSCLCLIITYSAKLSNVHVTGAHGHWLCITILNELIFWCPVAGSMANLITITIARYLKVVHPIWSKKRQRKWMVYTASIFAWIYGTALTAGSLIPTSTVVGGVCYTQFFQDSQTKQVSYLVFNVSYYVIMLLIFTFCYGRILIALRRQASVMAGHTASGSSAAQAQSKQSESSVIKTMIRACVLYVVTWTPLTVYYILLVTDSKMTAHESTYYALVFLIYLRLRQSVHLRHEV